MPSPRLIRTAVSVWLGAIAWAPAALWSQGKDSTAARPRPVLAAAPSVPGRAAVTAVTLGMVYISAGRNDGLEEGTIISIPKLGPTAQYRVAFLSSKSAAAKGDSTAPTPSIGDSVVFQPVKRVLAEASAGAKAAKESKPRRRSGRRLRGRIGMRYLGSWDRGSAVALRQPGLELLLDGPLSAGAPVGLSVDIRSRRTSLYRPGVETATRGVMGVYQAAVRVQAPQGPLRAVMGRQYAPTLAGIGLFDGLLIDLQKKRWGAGVMAGLAPELGTLGVSSEIRQAGVYFQGRSPLASPVRWSMTFGGMGSYATGELNREFGYFQGTLGSRVFNLVALQEVDYNRGWKTAAGEPRFSPTSSFVSAYLTPVGGVSFSGGFDSRRNVRLYRDLTTPEDVFDDRFRRGYWGGAHFTVARKLRFGGDVRTRTVEGADSLATSAYSATMSLDQVTALGLGLRLRGTSYETPGRGRGTLVVGSVRIAPPSVGSFEFNGGTRQEQGNRGADRYWGGAEATVFLKRSWFILATFTREWGREGLTPTTDLLYTGLSYRF